MGGRGYAHTLIECGQVCQAWSKKCIGREIEWETCGVGELDGRRYLFGCDEESFLLIWTAWSEVEGIVVCRVDNTV